MGSQSELLIARESTDISIHSICIYKTFTQEKAKILRKNNDWANKSTSGSFMTCFMGSNKET